MKTANLENKEDFIYGLLKKLAFDIDRNRFREVFNEVRLQFRNEYGNRNGFKRGLFFQCLLLELGRVIDIRTAIEIERVFENADTP